MTPTDKHKPYEDIREFMEPPPEDIKIICECGRSFYFTYTAEPELKPVNAQTAEYMIIEIKRSIAENQMKVSEVTLKLPGEPRNVTK